MTPLLKALQCVEYTSNAANCRSKPEVIIMFDDLDDRLRFQGEVARQVDAVTVIDHQLQLSSGNYIMYGLRVKVR